ncbi:MAG TPA: sugar ABC transporter ATP-binding protein [Candidatus Eremiobacteraceae bacterium]
MADQAPYLAMRGIAKSYPGVRALDGVDFDVRAGEVHALVGENGAGKSTLMKILAGAVAPDAGEIDVEGKRVAIASPRDAEKLRIAIIYQEFNLVPGLDVAANVLLGHEPVRTGVLDYPALYARAGAVFDRLAVSVPLRSEVRLLSVAQQQMVEIAKALSLDARVIVMDEPSASLTPDEVAKLFDVIRTLTRAGVAVVYISHRMEEIFTIADRITVLRDGKLVETGDAKSYDVATVIRLMVGRPLDAHFPPPAKYNAPDAVARPRLAVRDLSLPGRIDNVSFEVAPGEIFGLAGLVGSGRTSLLRAICGADIPTSGSVALDGSVLTIHGPHDAIAAGLALVTEDRKAQGLVLGMTIRENVTLPHLDRFEHYLVVDKREETDAVAKLSADLRIRTPSLEQLARNLSGGNQQKVVLAKWLLEQSRVICFDEPTRGIDVGAKAEIYELMNRLAAQGTAIVMASSELPEVLGMSTRIGVMRGGRIVHVFTREEATQESIIGYASGATAA